MPLEEPSWWYGTGPDDFRVRLLGPAAHVYAWAAKRRFRTAPAYRSRLPVICVGNFTAGGTGKTPLSLLIAERLQGLGHTPVFLTRGYGGRLPGPEIVDPGKHPSRDVGDEPLLLAQRATTVVSRDRVAGAQAIEAMTQATHIVMDDGLQNPGLAKSLSIAVVDGERGLGNGEVIPAGPLRAPIDFQFDLADAVVVSGGPEAPAIAALKRAFPGPVMRFQVQPDAAVAALLQGQDVVAFSGIGNPRRFTQLLERIGARIAAVHTFKDHHAFSETDARVLLETARTTGHKLVTTTKDLARLQGAKGLLHELAQTACALPITAALVDHDLERLEGLLRAAKPVSSETAQP